MMLPTWTSLLFSTLVVCETFDYVIIGGGTSGLVIANRLSENPSVTVAVIEPGNDVRDYPNVNQIDARSLDYINASIDWRYETGPQEGIKNQTILYHAGKAIGGTSTINGMTYLRGDEAQYDAWEVLGNDGWNWNSLSPYFKRSENFTVPTAEQFALGATYEAEFHGEEGYLTTGFPFGLDNGTFHREWVETWGEVGVPWIADPNGGVTEGTSQYPQTIDRDAGVRESSARAYYQPVEDRPNLKVIQGTVSRLILGKSSYGIVAECVEVVDASGDIFHVNVTREAIVSAGVYRSPLVLEASGIGNPNILLKKQIPTKVDLVGVGEGMQDQQLIATFFVSTEDILGYTPYVTFLSAKDIWGNETSSIAAATEAEITEWAQIVSQVNNNAISPDILLARFRLQHDLIFNKNVTISEVIPVTTPGTVGAVFWTLLPFSWGSVHLNSSSAADYPLISPNFLSVDFDINVLISVGRLIRKLYSTETLSSWVADQAGLGVPAQDATDEEWADYVFSGSNTNYHPIGTCAMLPRELGGVVNPWLQVYGTQNIRVVDASVIPIQMSGHPTATLYALAERAADLIKADW